MTDEQIMDGLAKARFGRTYEEIERDTPRSRTMRENVEWALPFVKQMMAKAYSDGQDAGYEDCVEDAEQKSPNPYV